MESIRESLREMNTTTGFSLPEVIREYDCPVCGSPIQVMRSVMNGKERIVDRCVECENHQLAEKAKRTQQKAISRRMKEIFDSESLINADLQHASFDNYTPLNDTQRKALAASRHFVSTFGKESKNKLLFTGPYGVGKSHLAKSITDDLIEKGYSSIFITVPRLFTKITSTWSRKNNVTEDDVISGLVGVDCLVLDDIGSEHIQLDSQGKGTGWGVTKIFEIVDARAGKGTILTTNLSGKQMENRFGQRNMSRLMHDTEVVVMTGEDYRRRDYKGA